MKKKLIKIANQILALEEKLQAGDNINENLEKMEQLTKTLSPDEIWEVNSYLESRLGFGFEKM